MPLRLTPEFRNAAVNAAVALADAGTGPATLTIYTGDQPATAADTATGTLLVEFTLNDPAFSTAVDGSSDLNVVGGISEAATGTGTAGWGRLADSDGNTIYDGLCSTDIDAEFTLNALSITTGQIIVLSGGTLSVPSGE